MVKAGEKCDKCNFKFGTNLEYLLVLKSKISHGTSLDNWDFGLFDRILGKYGYLALRNLRTFGP